MKEEVRLECSATHKGTEVVAAVKAIVGPCARCTGLGRQPISLPLYKHLSLASCSCSVEGEEILKRHCEESSD